MKVNEQINKELESQKGVSPGAGTFRVFTSNGEKILFHAPKVTRFSGKIKDFNDQDFCVVCGRPSQCGDFCSMSCQREQYGV